MNARDPGSISASALGPCPSKKRKRISAEGDRLSRLSDDLIIKILSDIDTKHAIQTSILSSRWKNIWKSNPHLNLSSHNFTSESKFFDFVTRVLSSRNNEIELSFVKLSLHEDVVSEAFLQKIMNYVFSHNIQKTSIIIDGDGRNNSEFPLSLFCSRSIKDLALTGPARGGCITITSSWDLPALTSLHLGNFTMSRNNTPDEFGGLFSKCPNLKNLTLTDCAIYVDDFIISHSQLTNLTLKDGFWYDLNVVAPHLKDLTIVNCKGELMISTPELSSLMMTKSESSYDFSADGLFSLEKVDFYIWRNKLMSWTTESDAFEIIDVLQLFHNVQYLTLGLEVVEVLASNVHLVSHLPSPFAKLRSLKIYPKDLYSEEGLEEIKMPRDVKNYLLGASPSASFSLFSREEMKALQNVKRAQKVMAELQLLLEKEKEKINCETAQTDDGEGKLVKEEISQIDNCWEDLFEQIQQGGFKINHIFSLLHETEDLLKKVPASKKDMIQGRLSSLRAESHNVIKLIMGSNDVLVALMNFL
ncbi:putative F-box/FBD/LRR-repeat protein At4g13965 [Rutidosis leptorrhynchoides]|uniref:putative F-box/FBD/LRR-repeat protein At4g13965 n=1 Tax=Rutidosis leptorrhynchoides TaxID=125765 RepID=UPI003A98DB10